MVWIRPVESSSLKQKVPVPWMDSPPAIPPTEEPVTGVRRSKQFTLPDIVIEQRVSMPILKESVSNLALVRAAVWSTDS